MTHHDDPSNHNDPELYARIAQLAHSYWEAEDRPEGRDFEHWLRAEADVLATTPVEEGAEMEIEAEE